MTQDATAGLRRRLQLVGEVVEKSVVGFAVVDREGRFVQANAAYLRIWGFERLEDLIATPAFLVGADPTRLGAILAGLRERGPDALEVPARRQDGSPFEVLVSLQSSSDDDGREYFLCMATDITDRKRAEARAREIQRQLRYFVAQAPIAIAMFDRDMVYLAASDRWASDFDRGFPELVGRCHYDVHPDLPDWWRAIHQRGFAGETIKNDEDCWVRADGVRQWLRWAVHPWRDDAGAIGGIIISSEDITHRMEAELALRNSEEKFARAFRISPDAINIIRLADGVFLDVNQGFCRLTGHAAEDVVGRSSLDLGLWADPAERERMVAQVRETGEVLNLETRFRLRDGSLRTGLLSARRIEVGGEDCILSITRDITLRKEAEEARWRAEEALRESEERYRSLAENARDAIFIVGADSLIQYVNTAAERFLGLTRTEILGRSYTGFFSAAVVAHQRVQIEQVFATGRPVLDESPLPSHTGERWVSTSLVPLRNPDGTVRAVLGVARDITERRSLEAQLSQAQKLEAIGQLAGGVAHDFNNMIGVILGFAMLIQEDLDDRDPAAEHLRTVIATAQRSADLTRQLLAFARRQVATPVPLNLNDSLTAVRGILERLIGENVTLHLNLAADLWNVKIDATQVDQIVANLASNARDAITDVGCVTIETANVTIGPEACARNVECVPGEYVRVVFRDDGRGMDSATRAHMFEPFFTTKPAGVGTGLGLATVFGIVKQNNGFIEVSSAPGAGASFAIHLPRHRGHLDAPVESSGQRRQPQGTETLLIVEDEAQLLEFARVALERQGYRVLCAPSPQAAIELCEQRPGRIDLLLTDVVMPGMNGKELKDRLADVQPGLKVVFMSGYTANVVAQRGILDGRINFLQKPFTLESLRQKVREVLDD